MYRFKTLTGHCLWARHIAAQATEVSVRVGRHQACVAGPSLVRNPFVSPEIMPLDAIASSHSIYATTPFPNYEFRINMQPCRSAA
ncbi:MAG: hypothetical protein E5299_00859 [Burkholderia gladioli]|nr:MAG: hypothetical protein E5299_00859 [Burkholderia gladioli]